MKCQRSIHIPDKFGSIFKGVSESSVFQLGALGKQELLQEFHKSLLGEFVDMHSLVNARLAHKWLDLSRKGIVETHAGHLAWRWYSSNDGGRFSLTRFRTVC